MLEILNIKPEQVKNPQTRELHLFAAAIAEHLPEWNAVIYSNGDGEPMWGATIQHTKGYAVHISHDNTRAKAHCSISWPQGWYQAATGYMPWEPEKYSRRSLPSVNLGLSREPAKAAADLQKRLLAQVPALWDKVAEYVDKQANNHSRRIETLKRLRNAAPDQSVVRPVALGLDDFQEGGRDPAFSLYRSEPYLSVEVRVYYDPDEIEIKLRTTAEKAEQILAIVG